MIENGKELNILIIEDSEEEVILLLNELKKSGFNVKWKRVENSKETKKAITEDNWDIILSDYKMPQFNASDALDIIKDLGLDIPFIVVSGSIGEENAVKIMKDGAHDFVSKNTPKRLIHSIERELEESVRRREKREVESLIKTQHDLSIALSAKMNLNEVLKICLETAIKISNMDSGAIYLINEKSGYLELIYYLGLSKKFIKKVTRFEKDTPFMNLIIPGKAIYTEFNELSKKISNLDQSEELQAISIIPIVFEGSVIGNLNISSHSFNIVPDFSQNALESITALIGGAIVRSKIEDELKKSEERYRELLDEINEGFFITDNKGVLVFANKALANILGYDTPGQIIGRNSADFIVPQKKEKYKKIFSGLIRGIKNANELEVQIFNQKKKIMCYLEIRTIPLFSEGKIIGMRGVTNDITERKLAEKEKEILNEELILKNKELEQLLYISSHDLRTPLVNIHGFCKEIEYTVENLMNTLNGMNIQEDIKEKISFVTINEIPGYLNYIYKSIKKMDQLIKGILKISRLGRVELKIKKIDMNSMITDILQTLDYQIKSRNITVKVEKLPYCNGDYLQINQVFSNLIDNAIKYFDVKKDPFIKINCCEEDDKYIYCIEDNGIGISKENLGKIFEIFHRINPENHNGEGLGLNIVSKILSMHKGKITVESVKGKGSKFYVNLPKL